MRGKVGALGLDIKSYSLKESRSPNLLSFLNFIIFTNKDILEITELKLTASMKPDLSLKTWLGASAPFTGINNYSFKLNKNSPTTISLQSCCFKL